MTANSCTSNSKPRPALFRSWVTRFFAVIISVSVTFFVLTELFIRYEVEPKDHFEQSIRVFYGSDKENVILGDSIPARGFTGRPEFVNLAFSGENARRMNIKARAYFQERKPGMVVVSANYNLFNRKAESTRGYEHIYQHYSPKALRVMEPRHRERVLRYWEAILKNGELRPRGRVLPDGTLLSTNAEEYLIYARQGPDELVTRATWMLGRGVPGPDFDTSVHAELYEDLMRFLKEKGADVCVVTFPVAPNFRPEMMKRPVFARVHEYFARVAARHGFKYRNYWDAIDTPSDLMDEVHLTPSGARKLTDMIVRDCFGLEPVTSPTAARSDSR